MRRFPAPHKPSLHPTSNPMEGCSLLLKFWWGLALLWPGGPLPITPGVLDMRAHEADWRFGVLLLAVGTFHLAGLLLDNHGWRRTALLGGVFLWVFVTARYAAAGWVFEAGVFGLIAFCAAWAHWRLGGEGRWTR